VISLSTIGLVNAESSYTGTTLHVDMGNGHFFELPYSISGATVTGVKADTSIPKMTISISATGDGQLTLQIPGGNSNSNQNDFTVFVDGKNSEYKQSFDNSHRMVTISFHANSSTIELVGQHQAPQYIQNMQYNQTSASCIQGDITTAKQGLADIQKKMADLRTQYYNDWNTAHNSGQYNGTWEQYSQEKFYSSQDIAQIKSDYQKYSSILRSCGTSQMQSYHSSTTCSQDDITHARQELATTEKQVSDLKSKIYQQFQQDQASGQYNGTWAQYAQERFGNLSDAMQLKSTHDKFTTFLKSCFGYQVSPQGTVPPNPNENSMPAPPQSNDSSNYNSNTDNLNQDAIGSDLSSTDNSNNMPPTDQPQDSMPPTFNPTDAQGIISSHGIPSWVKGIAGWWAEGKISDDDFVSAIKFLVHQGIIKL
jgi:predicted translin family RNA/ssDNA-binding protein